MAISTEQAVHTAAPKPAATTSQFTGTIPEIYDEHLGPLLFEFSAADLAHRVSQAAPGAGRVLEVACGTGISTNRLWQALAPETEIVATDLNDAMLDYARQKRGALTNVAYQQADAQDLPFGDNEFDAVVCQFGVMFFPDKARAFSEFARVLRPGGLLAFNVWESLDVNRVAGIARETIASFFESDAPDFLTVPFGFHDYDLIRQLVWDAGLDAAEFHRVSATIERPDAVSVARGFVEGNPGILQIRERMSIDPDHIVKALAWAIEQEFGPAPLQIPLEEVTVLARKP